MKVENLLKKIHCYCHNEKVSKPTVLKKKTHLDPFAYRMTVFRTKGSVVVFFYFVVAF